MRHPCDNRADRQKRCVFNDCPKVAVTAGSRIRQSVERRWTSDSKFEMPADNYILLYIIHFFIIHFILQDGKLTILKYIAYTYGEGVD